jgi:hypothetical protein
MRTTEQPGADLANKQGEKRKYPYPLPPFNRSKMRQEAVKPLKTITNSKLSSTY